ncbi:MAG: hypothetical protein RSD49_01645 [Hafnia sp.]
MARVQRFWKGRTTHVFNENDPKWSGLSPNMGMAFICAHSQADANRLITEYTGKPVPANETKAYFDEGPWGLAMKGVTPERGIWIAFGPTGNRSAPVKVA